jgi:hypothetical protein
MWHGAGVRTESLVLPFLFAVSLSGCDGHHATAFLPFSDLCPVYVEQVCAARESCCKLPESSADCELRLTDLCEKTRQQLSNEASLMYKGDEAERVSSEHEAELDGCKPAFPLNRFFSGGAAEGAACERATQCASGGCLEGQCTALKPTPLCEL